MEHYNLVHKFIPIKEHVASSRGTAYLWDKILRVTLKARGVQDALKSGTGEKGA